MRRQEKAYTTNAGVAKTPVLYQLVQEHLETFLAQVELETGAGLPEFVKEEFDAFLECGILARLPQLGAKKASNLLILRSWGRKGRHYKVMLVRPRGRRWR